MIAASAPRWLGYAIVACIAAIAVEMIGAYLKHVPALAGASGYILYACLFYAAQTIAAVLVTPQAERKLGRLAVYGVGASMAAFVAIMLATFAGLAAVAVLTSADVGTNNIAASAIGAAAIVGVPALFGLVCVLRRLWSPITLQERAT